MNRVEIVAGSCIALLAAVSIGQLYLDKMAPVETPNVAQTAPTREEASPPETKPVPVGEVIGNFLTALKDGSGAGRQVVLGSLLDELEGPEYASAALPSEEGTALAKAAIESVEKPGETPEESPEFKKRLVRFLASRVRSDPSKAYVLKVLSEGPQELREAALAGLGSPRGVGGKEVFEKVKGLGEQGLVSGEVLPGLLRRTGGKKAVESILAVMSSTDGWKEIAACAVSLQDYQDPALMGPVLERLEQTGMLEKPAMLPWISAPMLGKHLETAEGSALTRGLRAVKSRPSLIKYSIAAAQRGLEKGDPETRRVAAEAVKNAVIAKRLDPRQAETMLAGRLDHETEPVLKAELTGGLEQVRGTTETQKTPVTKEQ